MADFFESKWRGSNPKSQVIYRDLANSHIPHIQEKTISGFYTPEEYMSTEVREATALSDELIQELEQVDEILISSPMYNLNIPSSLKAYIDQVVRVNRTFKVDHNGYHGLLSGLKAHVLTVKGGSIKGTPLEKYDFQEPYLQAILGLMGIELESLFSLEGTSHEEHIEDNVKAVKMKISNRFN